MTTIYIQPTLTGGHFIRLQSSDPFAFKACIERLKVCVPSPHRVYTPSTKTWYVDGFAYGLMQQWVSHCRATVGARVEWLSADTSEESKEEPSPPPPPLRQLTKDDAYRTLYLQPNSPPDLVRHVFKYLPTIYHPDQQIGDEEKMNAINAAYKQLAA